MMQCQVGGSILEQLLPYPAESRTLDTSGRWETPYLRNKNEQQFCVLLFFPVRGGGQKGGGGKIKANTGGLACDEKEGMHPDKYGGALAGNVSPSMASVIFRGRAFWGGPNGSERAVPIFPNKPGGGGIVPIYQHLFTQKKAGRAFSERQPQTEGGKDGTAPTRAFLNDPGWGNGE